MVDLGAHLVPTRTMLTMGMFDEVYSHYPLPVPVSIPTRHHAAITRELAAKGLQTKDLDCLLSRYDITSGGRLFAVVRPAAMRRMSLRDNSDNTDASGDTYPDLDEACSDADSEAEHEDTRFHGRLQLHTIFFADDVGVTELDGLRMRVLGPDFDGEAYSIAYTLKFTDGTLVEVEDATATPIRRWQQGAVDNG